MSYETFIDDDGVECHDDCERPVEDCCCICDGCEDYLYDCTC